MIVLLLDERTRDDEYLFKPPPGMSKRLGSHTSTVPFVLGKEE